MSLEFLNAAPSDSASSKNASSSKTSNNNFPSAKVKSISFIDLFAGLGGTRIGFEDACKEMSVKPICVFTSEIKDYAIDAYKRNFNDDNIHGDITQISPKSIPDFDFLLAGFPCQPFSSAGNRHGFLDKRGGLFFVIHEILSVKKPTGFLLENVDGLVNHDKGQTLNVIITALEKLGYFVSWKILDASDFGVCQKRRRVYITGHKQYKPNLEFSSPLHVSTGQYIDSDSAFEHTDFTRLLSQKFSTEDLIGKSIKDKRGGKNNIHSWDLGLKGSVSKEQKRLLELILLKRRYKGWAEAKGIDWMDGMPLTTDEIQTFYDHPKLQQNLDALSKMGYLKYEHPKKRVQVDGVWKRVPNIESPKGYNIVAGKLSFPIAKIIDPNDFCPTLVATEAGKIAVATPNGVRAISVREGLRFSGFPDSYNLDKLDYSKAFDLIGNTVMPPVIKQVSLRILSEK